MIQLDVSILGQPYRLVCKAEEERALREAAAFLDKKMSAIRDGGKIKGNDRIAVMAALGMAAEFLSVKAAGPAVGHDHPRRAAKDQRHAQGARQRADAARKPVLNRETPSPAGDIGVNSVSPCSVRDCHIFLEPFMCAGCGILFDGRERR